MNQKWHYKDTLTSLYGGSLTRFLCPSSPGEDTLGAQLWWPSHGTCVTSREMRIPTGSITAPEHMGKGQDWR